MGNLYSSYTCSEVDANGHQRSSISFGSNPYMRVRHVTGGVTSSTVVEVMRKEDHWEGTSTVRPLHVDAIGTVTPINEPRLPVKLAAASTLDEKIEVLREAPEWMRTNDFDVSSLVTTRPTSAQRQSLRQILKSDEYQRLAVAYFESESQ